MTIVGRLSSKEGNSSREATVDRRAIQALADEWIDWRFKGFPSTDAPVRVADIARQRWNILDGDVVLPVLVVKNSAVEHNLQVMANYCSQHRVDLAPHAKTSMAPQLLARHLDAGAWGLTVATISQARTLRAFGFNRLLLASQIVEPAAVDWLSAELDADEDFECISLVDSVEGIEIVSAALTARCARRPLRVLVEVGQFGGRTGCRTMAEVHVVVKAVLAAPNLQLAGVEAFEGLIDAGSLEATMTAVDTFLAQVRSATVNLADAGAFDGLNSVIVTAGGSAYFDRVTEHLTNFDIGLPVQTILRSGGYATHDAEMYEVTSPLAARGDGNERLRAAFEVWGAVWSRPEPELAVVGMGKRDVPFDYGLPIPQTARARNGTLRSVLGSHVITALNDQHAYVRVPAEDPIAPGDYLSCGVSHPCTAFDKWRLIPVVNDQYRIIDALFTFF